jgi:hypothetical protein
VKPKQKHPIGLLKPILILECKWEVKMMDFNIGLPRMMRQHDIIMEVLYKMSKVSYFILVKSTHKVIDIAKIFMK